MLCDSMEKDEALLRELGNVDNFQSCGKPVFAKGGTHKLPLTTGGRNEKWCRILLYVVEEGRSLPSSDESVGVKGWTYMPNRQVCEAASTPAVTTCQARARRWQTMRRRRSTPLPRPTTTRSSVTPVTGWQPDSTP